MWRELLALLAAFAADPAEVDKECARACAAVSVARASMEKEQPADTGSTASDPPLVPVEQPTDGGTVECESGNCYYVDRRTGRRWRLVR